jgi:integrase
MLDRHGTWRHYLRRPGFQRVALPGDYGSPEFAEAYRLALGGSTALPLEIGASRTVTRSLGHLIVAYKQSEAWSKLAKSSQSPRRAPLEKLRAGPWGSAAVRDLGPKHIRKILADVKAAHTKRHWLKMLRSLFVYAIEHNWIEDNPTAGVEAKVDKSDGYHTWTDEEIAQYRARWPLGTQERLVLEFALETASRRCEVVRLGRQHVKAGRIFIERAKGSNAVDIPLTPELAAAIDAMPPNGALTYLLAPRGAPFSVANLGARFRQWATAAGLPQCTLHGLRKARCTQIANAGGTAHEIMGVSGHRSLVEVQRYTAKFNRTRAADAAAARLRAAVNPILPGLQSA